MIKKLIGLTLEQAKLLAAKEGKTIRVMAEDDQNYVGTCDYRIERINLGLKKGLVVEAWLG